MNSSGTSSCSGTGTSGCLGQEMKSRSMAVSTQSSISKYCTPSDFSLGSACWDQDVSQTGQGTYCSISGVPSLSVAVRAKWGQRGDSSCELDVCGCSERYPTTLGLVGFTSEACLLLLGPQGARNVLPLWGALLLWF